MNVIKQAELSQRKEIEMIKNNKSGVKATQNTINNVVIKPVWPDPIRNEAFYGLAGEIIGLIEPNSEADIVALLANFLTAFGNIIGNKPYFKVEGDKHPPRLFCALVGETSKARKGTSWGQIKNMFTKIDANWIVTGGLSSGEGLIWVVRDKVSKEDEILEEGVQDKRLLLVESEFASILKVLNREGNTLSPNLRNAWDTGDLRSLTKNNPAKATGAHISILAHITKDELLKSLSDTEKANGFGNRFIWFCVKRSKSLPFGGELDIAKFELLTSKLNKVIDFAYRVERIEWAQETRPLWAYIYEALSEGKTGLFGSMIARAEAHVLRLSCIYALLDRSALIKPEHLKAALALWDYAENSARYIFQDMTGSELADEILFMLSCSPEGATKTDIINYFGRHKSAEELAVALEILQRLGLVENETVGTDGRSKEVWYESKKNQGDDSHNSLNSQINKGYLGKLEEYVKNKSSDSQTV